MVVHGAVDQAVRGLRSSGRTISFQDAFHDYARVKGFLNQHGVTEGQSVGVVGVLGTYWARMGRFRIEARIPNREEFLRVEPEERAKAVKALARTGMKALVAKGAVFAVLSNERWQQVPGTHNYFVLFPPG